MKNKHITLISLNFYPEQTAIGLYSTQLAQYLEQMGAHVTVLTAFPYYPQWKIAEDYAKKPSFFSEKLGNIQIHRYKQFTPAKPSFLKRVLHIIDFTLGSWRNLKKVKECDIVISVIPFTSSAWLGNMLSRKHTAKHWIHIQDFEFDAAFQSGLTSNEKKSGGFIYKRLMNLERRILDKADTVSTISQSMIEKLKTKTDTETHYLPNWIEAENSDPSLAKNHPYLASDKCTILYSGNIGDKQDWSFFEQVINALDFTKYDVVIVGDGSKRQQVEESIFKKDGISFFPPVPYEELFDLLCSADVHVLFQKNTVIDTVMPSKVLGMMASARPSIITGHPDAEVAKVITQSKGGFYNTKNDVAQIIEQLDELRTDVSFSQKMGQEGRAYVLSKYAKKSILSTFSAHLEQL